jgi:hypothetical protein
MGQVGRNDPCPCGSGRKFKTCCATKRSSPFPSIVVLAVVAAILTAIAASVWSWRNGPQTGRVWSAEHGHYHDVSGSEPSR